MCQCGRGDTFAWCATRARTPPGPERAAYVNVEAASKFESAEFPDLDQLVSGTKEDQCVSAAVLVS